MVVVLDYGWHICTSVSFRRDRVLDVIDMKNEKIVQNRDNIHYRSNGIGKKIL